MMTYDPTTIIGFLETVHPFDTLPQDDPARIAASSRCRDMIAGQILWTAGRPTDGLFAIMRGSVRVMDPSGALVSHPGPRNSLGERGLMRYGLTATFAHAKDAGTFPMLPEAELRCLIASSPAFDLFFNWPAVGISARLVFRPARSVIRTRDRRLP